MNTQIKKRTLFVATLLVIAFIGLLGRVVWLQFISAEEILMKAEGSRVNTHILPAKRGTIYDRNGNILAYDSVAYTVSVNPSEIDHYKAAGQVVSKLAPIFNMSETELMTYVKKKKANGEYRKSVEVKQGRKISTSLANQVRKAVTELRIATEDNYFNGVMLEETIDRVYTSDRHGSQLLGFIDQDGNAQYGVESQYDDILSGTPGKLQYHRFDKNRFANNGRVLHEPAKDGNSIRLTIDKQIQHFLEEEMDKIYSAYNPKSMMAVALDPQTMEVLAISNRPTFDPNEFWNLEENEYWAVKLGENYSKYEAYKNAVISSLYEPGSTFKSVTAAAVLEEKLVDFEKDQYMSGSYKIAGKVISDWNENWGPISFEQALIRSSNTGFIKLGYEILQPKRFLEYVGRFGYNKRTGIDLPTEAHSKITPSGKVDFVTATFGQGKIMVSPIQQAVAFASLANGGKMMRPFVMKEVLEAGTDRVKLTVKPKVVGRSVTAATAKQTTHYLTEVVNDSEYGTGRRAKIDGYSVAGKTGTAQVYDPQTGRYSQTTWVHSFIGYAPADNPKFLLAVVVDQPNLNGDFHGGGGTVLPIFKNVTQKTLRYMKVSDSYAGSKRAVKADVTNVPELKLLEVSRAIDSAKQFHLKPVVLGKGPRVVEQFPAIGSDTIPGENLYLLTDTPERIEFPDLKGYSVRDVLKVCTLLHKTCLTEGHGYVSQQQPLTRNGTKMIQFTFEATAQLLKTEQLLALQSTDTGAKPDDDWHSE